MQTPSTDKQVEVKSKEDMTAREYFNGEGSPLTLDKICTPEEMEFLLDHIELYAKGKVNQYKLSQLTASSTEGEGEHSFMTAIPDIVEENLKANTLPQYPVSGQLSPAPKEASHQQIKQDLLLAIKVKINHLAYKVIEKVVRNFELPVLYEPYPLVGQLWVKIDEAISETLPPINTVVLGYNEKWVDEDFEPEGIRESLLLDGDEKEWQSAKWNGSQDCWFNDTKTKPTHWMQRPQPPIK